MNDPLIKVNDVVKDFTHHRALDHVSLEVERGKVHGLLGPNGAGKTTLIRILNHISLPDSGVVYFDGHVLKETDMQQIGYLPEERGLYPKMKAGEQAVYLAQLKGLSKQEATKRLKEWFERFEITDWWDKKINELSKGMAQKVQFAVTVLHQPKLLIFDEPFSGFDPVNTNLLKHEILKLRDEGCTVIFSTHNMQSVEEVCDNITLINRSRVVLNGSMYDIKERFRKGKFQVTFEETIETPELLQSKYQLVSREVLPNGHTDFIFIIPEGLTTKEVINDVSTIGSVVRFQEIFPTMNDIFLEIVGPSTTAPREDDPDNQLFNLKKQ